MLIPAAEYPIWPEFWLQIVTPLMFVPGSVYQLSGANGSGKSSFLSQLLLPRLRADKGLYCLYFEQQMRYQLQSVKAYASLFAPRRLLHAEPEVVNWLLEDLQRACQKEPRPIFLLVDESLYLAEILDFSHSRFPDCCLIFSSHSPAPVPAQVISFQPQTAQRSRVDAVHT